jgi:hypothetical protein
MSKKLKDEPPSCSICCNSLNKSKNKPTKCFFCGKEACLECVKHYILDTYGDIHCMFCRNKWNRDVLNEKLPQTFIKTELREQQENRILEMEKARLPAAQTIAEHRIKIKNIEMFREASYGLINQNDKNDSRIELLQLIAKNYGIDDMTSLTNLNIPLEKEQVKRNYIRNCPNSECRGFINEEWNCSLCKTKMCKKCFEQTDSDNTHKCDPNIIESNKLIAKDSKPCPNCNCLITKLSGCFAVDTPILLWNGAVKMCQDISIGDELVGDDGKKRIVQNLCIGQDQMYEVSQSNAMSYTVNSKHVLVLCDNNTRDIKLVYVDKYLELDNTEKEKLRGYKIVDNVLQLQKINVKPVYFGIYYGFMLNDNHRFLLPDNTVVKNCDQMFCVSCHTAFSWEKGTIEKGVIHNPHFYQWQATLTGQSAVIDMCNDNYFPSMSNLLTLHDKLDDYTAQWMGKFHQFFMHMYNVNRPEYHHTAITDEKMEINVKYMMTMFGKTEWKRQLYSADKRQEMARDIIDLIDMSYAIAGERFRNFIKDGKVEHIKDVEKLIIYVFEEVEKIRKRFLIKNVIITEPEWFKKIKNI